MFFCMLLKQVKKILQRMEYKFKLLLKLCRFSLLSGDVKKLIIISATTAGKFELTSMIFVWWCIFGINCISL